MADEDHVFGLFFFFCCCVKPLLKPQKGGRCLGSRPRDVVRLATGARLCSRYPEGIHACTIGKMGLVEASSAIFPCFNASRRYLNTEISPQTVHCHCDVKGPFPCLGAIEHQLLSSVPPLPQHFNGKPAATKQQWPV